MPADGGDDPMVVDGADKSDGGNTLLWEQALGADAGDAAVKRLPLRLQEALRRVLATVPSDRDDNSHPGIQLKYNFDLVMATCGLELGVLEENGRKALVRVILPADDFSISRG